jgi:hypothetical protein
MPVHAEKSFFVYQNWLRLDENARTAYIAGTIDTLSNINFDDAALIAGEHYTVCIQRSKMSAGQLTRNVIEFAKDKPPLHTGNVQSALIQYLIAACGAPPLPK